MKSAFRKISRVGGLTGGTKWYLSEDCLLAAKRMMYAVEYRRFYLRDLESIVVWPTRTWLWRMALVVVLFGFHRWRDFRRRGSRMGSSGTGTRADGEVSHSHHGSKRGPAVGGASAQGTQGSCQD